MSNKRKTSKTAAKKLSPQQMAWVTRRKLAPAKWGTQRQKAKAEKKAA
jgi:hypothetical protein